MTALTDSSIVLTGDTADVSIVALFNERGGRGLFWVEYSVLVPSELLDEEQDTAAINAVIARHRGDDTLVAIFTADSVRVATAIATVIRGDPAPPSQPKPTLKVGDRVRVTKVTGYGHGDRFQQMVGRVGVIESIWNRRNTEYWVNFGDGASALYFMADELERLDADTYASDDDASFDDDETDDKWRD